MVLSFKLFITARIWLLLKPHYICASYIYIYIYSLHVNQSTRGNSIHLSLRIQMGCETLICSGQSLGELYICNIRAVKNYLNLCNKPRKCLCIIFFFFYMRKAYFIIHVHLLVMLHKFKYFGQKFYLFFRWRLPNISLQTFGTFLSNYCLSCPTAIPSQSLPPRKPHANLQVVHT